MSATSPPIPPREQPPGDQELDLTFLTPGAQAVADVEDRLSAFLLTAEREVAIAIYDFHHDGEPGGGRVARTLQELEASGVRVRICDHDERTVERERMYPPPAAPPEYVDSLGLDVRPVTDLFGLMHHKYVVIDRRRVWTGSLNWTDDAFTLQENCVVRLGSSEIAAAYMENFEELWSRRTVAGTGERTTGWVRLAMNGDPVRVRPFFCPGRGPELAATIAGAIRRARRRIGVCSPVLTSGPILGALADVVTDGRVAVTGVVDRTQMQGALEQWARRPNGTWKTAAYRFIETAVPLSGRDSVPWAPGRPHDYMHAKIVVADDTAFVGSYNHSRSGEENAENVLAIEGQVAADPLMAFIEETAARYSR
jgi:phosphatidylserine/phosphatidylglycerophosphate/cardiolipin synthase-like enzyme